MIRVLIADDHGVIRDGLGRLIGALADMEVVGLAADGAEAVELCRTAEPDVVLMDLEMPGVDGIEATRRILVDRPGTAVLVLTSFSDRPRILGALEAGACGYLLKNIETDTLVDAIRKAAQGESVVSQQMTAKLIQGVRNPPKPEANVERDRFSPRERDILASLAQGESNKEIARRLDLAESTVKIHVQNIFKKLNMSSRVQVALYAVENGFGQGRAH